DVAADAAARDRTASRRPAASLHSYRSSQQAAVREPGCSTPTSDEEIWMSRFCRRSVLTVTALLVTLAVVFAQEPPQGRGRGAGPGAPGGQAPAAPMMGRTPVVDQAAHDRRRAPRAANLTH